MKTVSAGVLIINEFNEVFLAHPTHNKNWNLPKGLIEKGELPIQAAVRETKEEIGIQFSPSQLIDTGRKSYLPNKDLHLFVVKIKKEDLDPNDCNCESTFELYGKSFPEMDGFMWVPFHKTPQYCSSSLMGILYEIMKQLNKE